MGTCKLGAPTGEYVGPSNFAGPFGFTTAAALAEASFEAATAEKQRAPQGAKGAEARAQNTRNMPSTTALYLHWQERGKTK
jgi:hypothetical protein